MLACLVCMRPCSLRVGPFSDGVCRALHEERISRRHQAACDAPWLAAPPALDRARCALQDGPDKMAEDAKASGYTFPCKSVACGFKAFAGEPALEAPGAQQASQADRPSPGMLPLCMA